MIKPIRTEQRRVYRKGPPSPITWTHPAFEPMVGDEVVEYVYEVVCPRCRSRWEVRRSESELPDDHQAASCPWCDP